MGGRGAYILYIYIYIYIYIHIYIYTRFACGPIRGQRSCTRYNSHNVLSDTLEFVCSVGRAPDQDQTRTRPRPDQDQTKARPDQPRTRTRTGPRPDQDQPQIRPGPDQDQTRTSQGPGADQPRTLVWAVKPCTLLGFLEVGVHFDL